MLKTCQVCGRLFDGHPSARNCSIKCLQRHKHRRRKQREGPAQTDTDSPYQLIVTNISAEMLSTLYTNTSLHVYPKDIRINGPIPADVPRPSDVVLENLQDHHVIYHKSRQLVF